MKTFCFALQKGGVGKTSISVSVAAELAKTSKVILIDADPQGNSSSWVLGSLDAEFGEVLLGEKKLEEAIAHTKNPNLDVLGTFGIGGKLKDYRDSAKASKFPYAILDLCEILSKTYDFCIIDTSPSNTPLETACYLASDSIIPVLQLNQFSIDGLEIFQNNLSIELKAKRPAKQPLLNAIVVNAKNDSVKDQREKMEKLASLTDHFTIFVFPVDQAFSKAQKANITTQEVPGVKADTLETLKDMASFMKE